MESYNHLNAEFQRIARKDKKAFLSEQCKELEENNKKGKTRDLFKKIRDTKGTFHAKMGSIKDRDDMDLIEAEDIKKRWQEYTEVYKKDLHDPDNCDGMITHLEPDVLECEVRWALGNITTNKASGGNGSPARLFPPDAGKLWRQEEKGTTEDKMVGWHHWLNGHEFEQTPGDSEGQGSLVCCSPWDCKELNMTEQLNKNKFFHYNQLVGK